VICGLFIYSKEYLCFLGKFDPKAPLTRRAARVDLSHKGRGDPGLPLWERSQHVFCVAGEGCFSSQAMGFSIFFRKRTPKIFLIIADAKTRLEKIGQSESQYRCSEQHRIHESAFDVRSRWLIRRKALVKSAFEKKY